VNKIGIIDYGMGNIHSVKKSIENVGGEILLINKKVHIRDCKALVIPGQGAFDPAIDNLIKTELILEVKDWISKGNPFLGICLGLQLLFESSEEGLNRGLGLVKGKIKKIPPIKNQRIPHIGWCNLIFSKKNKFSSPNSHNNWFYFDHSYHAVPCERDIISAYVEYGAINLTAIIEYENLVACQFHPEKSGKAGEYLIYQWLRNIK